MEKLTQPEDWKRAYAELNDFEEQLQEDNNILLKFWLHISPDEQLRRFKEREEIPWKIIRSPRMTGATEKNGPPMWKPPMRCSSGQVRNTRRGISFQPKTKNVRGWM